MSAAATTHKTVVVNLYAAPADAVYIGRAGRGQDGYFGNRFPRETPGCLELFEDDFVERVAVDAERRRRTFALEGRALACPGNCKPGPCHGDTYVRWIESKREELEERAAILEFEAGLSREDAERAAREMLGL